MDFQVFDNFEEDGQLSMFDMAESIEDLQISMEEPEDIPISDLGASTKGQTLPSSGSAGCRIRHCSTCGRILFVKEEGGFYTARCNACGMSYSQKQ